jgi:hypothetical protein
MYLGNRDIIAQNAHETALMVGDAVCELARGKDCQYFKAMPPDMMPRLLQLIASVTNEAVKAARRRAGPPPFAGPAVGHAHAPTASATGQGQRASESSKSVQLTNTAKTVLAIIKAQPQGKGIKGQSIVNKLDKQGIEIASSTLRRHIIPKLKADHGVIYDRARGGYLIPR